MRQMSQPTSRIDTHSKRDIVSAPAQTVLRGLFVGFAATQVLDLVSHFLYEGLDPKVIAEEERARKNKQAYEVAVQKIAGLFGRELTESEMKFWGWKFHRTFGLAGGVQFMALRKAAPSVGAGLGIPFGLAFWLVADEFLIYVTGLVPGPQHFSWKSHLRGAIGHVAWAVAAELTARSYDLIEKYEGNFEPVRG